VRRARFGLVLLLTVAAPAASPAGATRVGERSTFHMHGRRYCEYFIVKGQLPRLSADVWNTYGLNDCPARQWNASDAAGLAKQLGAVAVVLNGPRYWLIDGARLVLPPGSRVTRFPSGLRMRKVASIEVPVHDGTPGAAPYTELTVDRRNTFTWSRRYPVYELVSPGGRAYVMQSFSRIVDRSLRLTDLRTLGRRLELPPGWRFRTRRLSHDFALTTRGKAAVLQDDLQDTYQLATGAP
jgi:hypothetical protein